eukprot:7041932-Prymnesium_polylepis.1
MPWREKKEIPLPRCRYTIVGTNIYKAARDHLDGHTRRTKTKPHVTVSMVTRGARGPPCMLMHWRCPGDGGGFRKRTPKP